MLTALMILAGVSAVALIVRMIHHTQTEPVAPRRGSESRGTGTDAGWMFFGDGGGFDGGSDCSGADAGGGCDGGGGGGE